MDAHWRDVPVPSTLYGVPLYLGLAILFFVLVLVIGLIRGRAHRGTAPRAARGGLGSTLQLISAILGILSFVMQVLQWLKII
jgi:hypothetical protein